MFEIRTITAADSELFRRRVSGGFGSDADTDEAASTRFEAIFELDRTLAAFDGDDIIGTGAAFSLGLTVPGGAVVPMGGTTVVTVQPTHRRRGVLRSLMGSHLDDVAGRDEPLAGLWASESSIYRRFGYGPASFRYATTVNASAVELMGGSPGGTVRLIEPDEAESVVRPVYDRARSERSGMLTRSDAWWAHRLMADPESWRGGKSAQRHVAYEQDGAVTGYAVYRQKSKWDNFLADGEIDIIEVIVTTGEAHSGLWAFLSNIDLFPNLEWWNMPIDDPLPMKMLDSRRVARKLVDGLWVRVMDVPAALEARTYDHDGVVDFALADVTRPQASGTYRLEVSNGEAHCERVTEDGDLALDIDVLGSLYLGGGDAMAMFSAGRITGDGRAVQTLHRMLRTDVAPWCPEVF